MTELGFLMELFLDDDVPKPIKSKIAERIKIVEANLTPKPSPQPDGPIPIIDQGMFASQAPSMRRIMQQHPDLVPPPPVTAAAAQALAARQALLESAGKDRPEPGRNSPRKI